MISSTLPTDLLKNPDPDDLHHRWRLGKYLIHAANAARSVTPSGVPSIDLPGETSFFRVQAVRLNRLVGATYSLPYLRSAAAFYRAFPEEKWLDRRLSWSHYRVMIPLPSLAERKFYLSQSLRYAWTARQLTRQVWTRYYDRTRIASPLGIKAHYMFDFVRSAEGSLSEGELERQLCERLTALLLELGPDFSFVARQKMLLRPGGGKYFVDLVFYRMTLRRHLLIELKTTPLTHRDVGQLDTYVRLFDRHYRFHADRPTIGLLLCPEFAPDLLHYSALADQNNLLVASYEWAAK